LLQNGTSYFLRSCVKIYTIGLWDYQGEDKFEKIGIMLAWGERAELEEGRAEREQNKLDVINVASSISTQVPGWIKNNAGWRADGLITEDDFVKGIQYLVEQGLIKV